MFIPNQTIFGKSSQEKSSSEQMESIKIVSPITTQDAITGKELLVSGQSSDNSLKNCSVSIIVNDVRPYQNAVANGMEGINDFSQWKFLLDENYTHIIDGKNKITAKLLCESAPTRWYSVFVNGVPNLSNQEILSTVQPSPVESTEPSGTPIVNLSDIDSQGSNDNTLLVSVLPQKDPVGRGDSQNTTITVTDSVSRAIPNAEIEGKLIYPGNNFEKKFKGKTDYEGKFVYSWTIGKKGDVGPLNIEVDASSHGYRSSSVKSSFDIVDSSQASNFNNVLGNSQNNKPSEFDFVVAGDYGCDAVTKRTVENIEKEEPNLVLALGDLSEVNNPACFFDIISNLDDDDKLKIALGGQDTDDNTTDSSSRFSDFVRHFELESPFYSFDYHNVHFLAMSTGKPQYVPYENGSAQYEFVKDDLSEAASDPNIDWIIVYGYRPFYTSPTTHPASDELRETYSQLFEKYGVDLVLNSHNHNYQRSYPLLYNIAKTSKPIIKDQNTTNYDMPGVPIFVGVGTAGNNLYNFSGQAPYMVTQFRENGFLHVNVTTTDKDILTATFQNLQNGNMDDRFTILKEKSDKSPENLAQPPISYVKDS